MGIIKEVVKYVFLFGWGGLGELIFIKNYKFSENLDGMMIFIRIIMRIIIIVLNI